MGQSNGKEEDLNLAHQLKPNYTGPLASAAESAQQPPTYDQMAELDSRADGDRNDNTTSIHRSRGRSSWWFVLFFVGVFVVLASTAGIVCALDHVCSIHEVPSLGTFLNSSSTSPLAITALNALLATHFVITVNTGMLVKDYSLVSQIFMWISAIGFYAMLYVSLIVLEWYIAITPIACLVVWGAAANFGLARFYRAHPTRKLYFATLIVFGLFVIPALLYIAFSAVPDPMLPHKQVAIFVCELNMLVFYLLFVLLLVYHTRRVSYVVEVKKGYVII
jgi:hypothetical protein